MSATNITFGSVCSGIEAASVAWHPIGWRAAWVSEIEKFPSAVLAHHHPDTPNLGDMTTIGERVLAGEVDAPRVLVGGTPCQAFSVAGLRGSLDDERGQLTLEYVRLLNDIEQVRRNSGLGGAIGVWENVPGVLNTKDNAFGCFLGALAGEAVPIEPPGQRWGNAGYVAGPERTIAWRVLDAQYFGVAQRRRRVFVVACSRGDICPREILFECQGVRRDNAPGREEGQKAAPTVTTGAPLSRSGGGELEHEAYVFSGNRPAEVNATLQTTCDDYSRADGFTTIVQPSTYRKLAHGYYEEDIVGGTLRANLHKGADTSDLVAIKGNIIGREPENGGNGLGAEPTETMYTLTSADRHAVAFAQNTRDEVRYVGGDRQIAGALAASPGIKQTTYVAQPLAVTVGFDAYNNAVTGDITKTLDTGSDYHHVPNVYIEQPATAFKVRSGSGDGGKGYMGKEETAYTVKGVDDQRLFTDMQVRRLTPVECERLQGFPDNYTDIRPNNKDTPDGPRYKALGNSMAVPVMRFIGEQIERLNNTAA